MGAGLQSDWQTYTVFLHPPPSIYGHFLFTCQLKVICIDPRLHLIHHSTMCDRVFDHHRHSKTSLDPGRGRKPPVGLSDWTGLIGLVVTATLFMWCVGGWKLSVSPGVAGTLAPDVLFLKGERSEVRVSREKEKPTKKSHHDGTQRRYKIGLLIWIWMLINAFLQARVFF